VPIREDLPETLRDDHAASPRRRTVDGPAQDGRTVARHDEGNGTQQSLTDS